MKKDLIDLDIQPTRAAKETLRLLKQMPQRVKAMQAQLAYRSAMLAREEILAKTAGTELGRGYQDALQVTRVSGVSKSLGSVFALAVKPTARRVRKIDAKRTVLLVQARRSKLVPPKPDVVVLSSHGPWTLDTLPFVPAAKDGIVLSRKVSAAEAAAVEDKQRSPGQILKIKRLLAEAGFIDRRKEIKVQTPPVVRAIPDLAYAGLRAEFGVDGARNPHWRPALRYVKTVGLKRLAKSRAFRDVIGKVRYSAWKRWPPRVRARIPVTEAKSFSKFQKRLRVR